MKVLKWKPSHETMKRWNMCTLGGKVCEVFTNLGPLRTRQGWETINFYQQNYNKPQSCPLHLSD